MKQLTGESNGHDGDDDDQRSSPDKESDAVDNERYNRIAFVKLYNHFHRVKF
jgi:hypothetical protein